MGFSLSLGSLLDNSRLHDGCSEGGEYNVSYIGSGRQGMEVMNSL